MLIGYSTFLINTYLGILVFQLGIFVNDKTLLTKLIHFMSDCCYEQNLLLFSQIILNKC